MSKVLIVGNEQTTIKILTKLLKTEGYKVACVEDASKLESGFQGEDTKLVISFSGAVWDSDFAIAGRIRDIKGSIPLIMIAENSELAQKCQLYNPYTVFEKPLKVDQLISTVQRAVDFYEAEKSKKVHLDLQVENSYPFENIVAESTLMKSLCEMISRVAGIDVTVLVTGEDGTGRQEIARTIHENSRRKDAQLMVFDCSMPDPDGSLFGTDSEKGVLENADKCTLFLKDVERLPMAIQDKLAKALTDKKVAKTKPEAGGFDTRVIASCQANIEQLVIQFKFSPNLFKMIRVLHIKVPALRERKQDILPIVRRLIIKNTPSSQPVPAMDKAAIECLEKYPWPGNIRELESVVLDALKQAKNCLIDTSCLPQHLR